MKIATIAVANISTVVPETDLTSGGPVGGPFPGSVVYTLTSQRPSPVNVQVVPSAAWISLNGGAGPLNVNLSGTGDSATVHYTEPDGDKEKLSMTRVNGQWKIRLAAKGPK